MSLRFSGLLFLLLCLTAFLGSCEPEGRFVRIEAASGLSLEVAGYFSEMENLHPEATFRYGNVYRNRYLLVQQHRLQKLYAAMPEADTEDFYALTAEELLKDMTGSEILVPDSVGLGGWPALLGSLEGSYQGDQLQYLLAVVEGDSMLYQVLCWSTQQEFPAFEADARRMIESFQLP